MKPYVSYFIAFLMVISLTSCEVIAGIFEAGVWVGVLIVVAIIALVIWLIRKATGRR